MTKEFEKQQDDQAMQALLGAALRPGALDAPSADLAERIVAATPPRLRRRGVVGRIGVAAGLWAAAACLVVAVGLGGYWLSDRETPRMAWSSADEMEIARLAEGNAPREQVEVELRTLALAVDDAQDGGRESAEHDDLAEYWTQSEAEIGLF